MGVKLGFASYIEDIEKVRETALSLIDQRPDFSTANPDPTRQLMELERIYEKLRNICQDIINQSDILLSLRDDKRIKEIIYVEGTLDKFKAGFLQEMDKLKQNIDVKFNALKDLEIYIVDTNRKVNDMDTRGSEIQKSIDYIKNLKSGNKSFRHRKKKIPKNIIE